MLISQSRQEFITLGAERLESFPPPPETKYRMRYADLWQPEITYVIGHRRPDMDAIASAAGYAWYLSVTESDTVVAACAGPPPQQALYAVERFEQPLPEVLTEVFATFAHAARPRVCIPTTAPLSDAVSRLAQGAREVPVVDAELKPLGVVTPATLARALRDPARAAAVLAEPCIGHVEAASTFQGRERICDHRAQLLRQETDDFLVTDDDGRYLGVATRGQILNPPRARLVLVDHNELSQAVAGAEESQITGVLDHHRLGNPPTASPIPFVVDPVGSTSTLVAERCRDRHLPLPTGIAGLLISGLLSDTLVFRSPTTTERDREVAAWLAWVARVDIQTYGEELLRAGPGLAGRAAEEILEADRKTYTIGSKQVSIAQVEVTGLQELNEVRAGLLAALEAQLVLEGLSLACLMVTDVIRGRSRLLCQGEPPLLGELPFRREMPGQYELGEVVSRKKQLVPAILQALEQVA